MIVPSLTSDIPVWGSENLPSSTCYRAGTLVNVNAGWRTVRPVIDAGLCKGCYRCYLHCPDGTIRMESGKATVDYDFCKGCGICARICSFGCISMEAER